MAADVSRRPMSKLSRDAESCPRGGLFAKRDSRIWLILDGSIPQSFAITAEAGLLKVKRKHGIRIEGLCAIGLIPVAPIAVEFGGISIEIHLSTSGLPVGHEVDFDGLANAHAIIVSDAGAMPLAGPCW